MSAIASQITGVYICLRRRLFRSRSKKASKLHVTGLYEGNSPVTGEFTIQRASNAENISFWWRHHAKGLYEISCRNWAEVTAILLQNYLTNWNITHIEHCSQANHYAPVYFQTRLNKAYDTLVHDITNNLEITVLCHCALPYIKSFRITFSQLHDYMTFNGLLLKGQHGFRIHHDTVLPSNL